MTDTNRPERNDAVLHEDTPRTETTSPETSSLMWLLLLLAVAAFAWWYFANRADTTAPVVGPDLTIIEGNARDAAAEAERADPPRATTDRSKPVASTAPAMSEPELLTPALPRYPVEERRRGVEGDVTLRIDVGANGVPTDVAYASRSGNRALDRAAMTAAQNWRFQPATRNGQAVASTVNVPVAFRL